jgi:hypothetical protein
MQISSRKHWLHCSLVFWLGLVSNASEPAKETPAQPDAAEQAPATQPELETFVPLWTRSLFTSAPPPAEPVLVPTENAEWAAHLSFLGWAEIEGTRSVYIHRTDTDETFVLTLGTSAQEGVMEALEIINADSMMEAQARVRLNGQEALIRTFEAPVPPPEEIKTAATRPSTPVEPPTTADSRAQRLTQPVLLTEDNTFEKSLQPNSPERDNPPAAADVIQELRQRNDMLHQQQPLPAAH